MNKKKNKTAVIILGAAATFPWGGPSSGAIEQELFKDKEFMARDSVKNLAEYIKDQLVGFYNCNPKEINFEYIINSLESFSDYLYEKTTHKYPRWHGSQSLWFKLREDTFNPTKNFDFRLLAADNSKGQLLNLAVGDMGQWQEINHESVYLNHCIRKYLEIIRDQVWKYDREWYQPKDNQASTELKALYDHLKNAGYTVRFYPTNYDSLFPNLFEQNFGVKLFTGFEDNKQGIGVPNIKRILTDYGSDSHYNLHGSMYWKLNMDDSLRKGFNHIPGMVINELYSHGEYTGVGEYTLIHNIVTGFNKLKRISVEPLKSFFTALANDCINADLITTVGYSYGDNHINRILKHGIDWNNSKFLHVTKSPNFFGHDSKYTLMQDFVLRKNRRHDFDVEGDYKISQDKTMAIYTAGFEEFLKSGNWKKAMDLLC